MQPLSSQGLRWLKIAQAIALTLVVAVAVAGHYVQNQQSRPQISARP